jgi:hypothetical protein
MVSASSGTLLELEVKRRSLQIAGSAPRLEEILERHSDRNQQLRIVRGACNCLKRTATPVLASTDHLPICEVDTSGNLWSLAFAHVPSHAVLQAMAIRRVSSWHSICFQNGEEAADANCESGQTLTKRRAELAAGGGCRRWRASWRR